MTFKNPSIILVRPQLPENIGMVARVMHNFGLKDLIIVSPRDNWLNTKSINSAKKADKILKNIKVYKNLETALKNFTYVVATTNRKRFLDKNSKNDFIFIKKKLYTPYILLNNHFHNNAIIIGGNAYGIISANLKKIIPLRGLFKIRAVINPIRNCKTIEAKVKTKVLYKAVLNISSLITIR